MEGASVTLAWEPVQARDAIQAELALIDRLERMTGETRKGSGTFWTKPGRPADAAPGTHLGMSTRDVPWADASKWGEALTRRLALEATIEKAYGAGHVLYAQIALVPMVQ